MPRRVAPTWTPERDARLREMKAASTTWHDIAADLGVTYAMAVERGRRLNILTPMAGARLVEHARTLAPEIEPERLDRPAKCAGHPDTWGLLGMAEPYPLPTYPGGTGRHRWAL